MNTNKSGATIGTQITRMQRIIEDKIRAHPSNLCHLCAKK